MKRFAFRLERVRRLRDLARREAEAALAKAYAFAERLRGEAEDLARRAERASEELNAKMEQEESLAGDYVRLAGRRIAALRDAETRRRTELALAMEEIARRKLEYVERKRAHEVLEKLRGKKRREWIVEADREEQSGLDEIHRALSRRDH